MKWHCLGSLCVFCIVLPAIGLLSDHTLFHPLKKPSMVTIDEPGSLDCLFRQKSHIRVHIHGVYYTVSVLDMTGFAGGVLQYPDNRGLVRRAPVPRLSLHESQENNASWVRNTMEVGVASSQHRLHRDWLSRLCYIGVWYLALGTLGMRLSGKSSATAYDHPRSYPTNPAHDVRHLPPARQSFAHQAGCLLCTMW